MKRSQRILLATIGIVLVSYFWQTNGRGWVDPSFPIREIHWFSRNLLILFAVILTVCAILFAIANEKKGDRERRKLYLFLSLAVGPMMLIYTISHFMFDGICPGFRSSHYSCHFADYMFGVFGKFTILMWGSMAWCVLSLLILGAFSATESWKQRSDQNDLAKERL